MRHTALLLSTAVAGVALARTLTAANPVLEDAAARAAESVPATRVDPGTLAGKVMVGYQGWFNAEGDGARRGYNHWSRGGAKPAPGNVRVDLWPDLSEFPAAERFPTDLVHADGSRAEVFSSFLRPTVVRHFAWMQEHGIDGGMGAVIGLSDEPITSRAKGTISGWEPGTEFVLEKTR